MSSQGLNDSVSEVGKGRFRPEADTCLHQRPRLERVAPDVAVSRRIRQT